jgi:hypothetical protein
VRPRRDVRLLRLALPAHLCRHPNTHGLPHAPTHQFHRLLHGLLLRHAPASPTHHGGGRRGGQHTAVGAVVVAVRRHQHVLHRQDGLGGQERRRQGRRRPLRRISAVLAEQNSDAAGHVSVAVDADGWVRRPPFMTRCPWRRSEMARMFVLVE